MPVCDTHNDYGQMLPRWNKMRDVCSDEDTIHLRDIGAYSSDGYYLPKLDKQTEAQYTAYVNRASFVMFTSRIIEGFVGMVMRKPVMITGADNPIVDEFIKNVDGKGNSFGIYTGDSVLFDFLKYRRGLTVVEMPVVNNILSVADAESKRIMPKFVFYDTFSIISWRTTIIDNTEVLTRVVLEEEIEVPNPGDEFNYDNETQYRVLDLDESGNYRQRVFDNSNMLVSETYPKKNGQFMRYLPVVLHGGIKPMVPGLLGIANLNLHHYRKDADYSHGLHWVALPTPYSTGTDAEGAPSTIGPTEWQHFENPETKVGMLEFSGQGLGEIAKKMDSIVEMIIMLSSRILAPQQVSNETALGASIRSSNETSTLAGQVSLITQEMTTLLKIAMDWAGVKDKALAVEINKDFIPIQLSGADAMAYMTNWIKGAISYESLFEIYKKGELIPANRAIEDEKKDIEAESAVRMAVEVEMAKKLGKATAPADDDLPDENVDNNFK